MNKFKIFGIILGVLVSASLVLPEGSKAVETTEKPRAGLASKLFNKAAIGTGKVIEILPAQANSSYGIGFKVSKDNKDYTVWTDSKTQCRRNFWGKCEWSEIQVNDTLNVIGKWTDETRTTILAKLIRDHSIQKRNGVFFGEVTQVTSTGWVMKTGRGNETITVSATTKFLDRKEQVISQADILVGHKVRVRGLWDKTNSTITEVTQVKDFNIPAQPKTSTNN